MRSLGVDVSLRRGLDVVLLDASRRLLEVCPRVKVDDLPALLSGYQPDVVAIDSPPAWGLSGNSRLAERVLRRAGISSYATPSDPEKRTRPFYRWMEVGFRVFKAAAAGRFHRFRRGNIRHTAIEVFPYATTVVLTGGLRPRSIRKRVWRTRLLQTRGLDVERLHSIDAIDAALAALTGLRALQGRFTAVGDPREGVIVLPVGRLPPRPYAQPPPR